MSSYEKMLNPQMKPALILGGSLSGLMVAKAFADLSLATTLIELPYPSEQLFFTASKFDLNAYKQKILAEIKNLELMRLTAVPDLDIEGDCFRALFQDGTVRNYGCIVITAGVLLYAPHLDFRGESEIFSAETSFTFPEKIAFLFDLDVPTHPAIGMAALNAAIENSLSGGESSIFFRNIPVAHAFGESLYEQAKKQRVQFFRFADKLPIVSKNNGAEFQVTVKDVIQNSEEISVRCNRVIMCTRPDPKSIPDWAINLLGKESHQEELLLSENIHNTSGKSFRRGVFVLGEATGSLDLVRVGAQAAAVAVNARAWMTHSITVGDAQSLHFSDQCIRCLTCYRICPHFAISFSMGAARSDIYAFSAFCKECGICISECPRLAIKMGSFSDECAEVLIHQFGQNLSDSIVLLGCKRSVGRILQEIDLPSSVKTFFVPCAGRISENMIWSVIVGGAKGLLIMGCHDGSCKSDSGTRWAAVRVNSVLEQIGFFYKHPTVKFVNSAPNERARITRLIKNFCSEIEDKV